MATVLIGFMGAGKSSAARRLSDSYVDTDALIEEREGKSVVEIFAAGGEAAFRTIEEDVVVGALGDAADDEVGGLGGGAVGSAAGRAALGAHTVVWLAHAATGSGPEGVHGIAHVAPPAL